MVSVFFKVWTVSLISCWNLTDSSEIFNYGDPYFIMNLHKSIMEPHKQVIEVIEKLESNRPLGLCQTPSLYILYILYFFSPPLFSFRFPFDCPFPPRQKMIWSKAYGRAAWYRALRNPCIGPWVYLQEVPHHLCGWSPRRMPGVNRGWRPHLDKTWIPTGTDRRWGNKHHHGQWPIHMMKFLSTSGDNPRPNARD